MLQNNWFKTLILNLSVLYAAFERTCRLSVVIYFLSLPFVDWRFYKIFLWTFLFFVLQIIFLFKINYRNIREEVIEQLNKEPDNKEE